MPVLSLTLGGLLPAGNAVWCAWMDNGHLEPPTHGQGCELFFFRRTFGGECRWACRRLSDGRMSYPLFVCLSDLACPFVLQRGDSYGIHAASGMSGKATNPMTPRSSFVPLSTLCVRVRLCLACWHGTNRRVICIDAAAAMPGFADSGAGSHPAAGKSSSCLLSNSCVTCGGSGARAPPNPMPFISNLGLLGASAPRGTALAPTPKEADMRDVTLG
ncbi:hypothetical protein BC826DRAFT_720012 [Russula brevipes]|nr:hypothetical protein BC826DRAFT_720012 [Russula brevipes]